MTILSPAWDEALTYIFMHTRERAQGHLVVIRAAEASRTLEISRRGVLVAVLFGSKRFAQPGPKRPGFMEAYRTFLRKTDLAALDLDPDEIFAGVRDRSPGRDFPW